MPDSLLIHTYNTDPANSNPIASCYPACACCCLGPDGHNNCCGATCCKDRCVKEGWCLPLIAPLVVAHHRPQPIRLIIDILDRQGQVVAHAARVFGKRVTG